MLTRFKALRFPSGRANLDAAADRSLRNAALSIREVDENMPLLLIARGGDDKTVDLGLRRCQYVRKRLVAFGLSPKNIGAICERRERPDGSPAVILLILK